MKYNSPVILIATRIVALATLFFISIPGASPQGIASAPSNRTELLFLGTAGGPPLRLDRSEPSTLLIVDGRSYLIDCGIGTMRRMLRAQIPSESIKTIFFTHLHADHDLGLADVMGNDFFRLNLVGSHQNVTIYGPPQTKQLVDAAFQFIRFGFTDFAAEPGAIGAGLVNGELTSPFVALEIQGDGLVFQDSKIRVTAAENSHFALMSPENRKHFKSYSYRFETPHGSIVFTGDTGPSDAVVRLAQGADALVTEVEDQDQAMQFVKRMAAQNHWSAEREAGMIAHMRYEHLGEQEAGALATKAHVKSVVLYHYNPTDPAAEVAAVEKNFSGPVFASSDLSRYCLGTSGGKSVGNPILAVCEGDSTAAKADRTTTSRTLTARASLLGEAPR